MRATHRVKDSTGQTVGFIIDESFYTEQYIRSNVQYIDNLYLSGAEIITGDEELYEIDYRAAVNDREYNRTNPMQKMHEVCFTQLVLRHLH